MTESEDDEKEIIPLPVPEPDWTGIAIRKLDINKLPPWMRDLASQLLTHAVARRGTVTRRIHDPEEDHA